MVQLAYLLLWSLVMHVVTAVVADTCSRRCLDNEEDRLIIYFYFMCFDDVFTEIVFLNIAPLTVTFFLSVLLVALRDLCRDAGLLDAARSWLMAKCCGQRRNANADTDTDTDSVSASPANDARSSFAAILAAQSVSQRIKRSQLNFVTEVVGISMPPLVVSMELLFDSMDVGEASITYGSSTADTSQIFASYAIIAAVQVAVQWATRRVLGQRAVVAARQMPSRSTDVIEVAPLPVPVPARGAMVSPAPETQLYAETEEVKFKDSEEEEEEEKRKSAASVTPLHSNSNSHHRKLSMVDSRGWTVESSGRALFHRRIFALVIITLSVVWSAIHHTGIVRRRS